MQFVVFPYSEDFLLATKYGTFYYIVIDDFLRKLIFLKITYNGTREVKG